MNLQDYQNDPYGRARALQHTSETYVISAYAAPDGVVLGPVDLAGEAVIAVGRAGGAWVQLERLESGARVWFRRVDLPPSLSVPDGLPDLAPRPAPEPPQAGPAPIIQQQPYIEAAPPPPPPPAQNTEVKPAADRANASPLMLSLLDWIEEEFAKEENETAPLNG